MSDGIELYPVLTGGVPGFSSLGDLFPSERAVVRVLTVSKAMVVKGQDYGMADMLCADSAECETHLESHGYTRFALPASAPPSSEPSFVSLEYRGSAFEKEDLFVGMHSTLSQWRLPPHLCQADRSLLPFLMTALRKVSEPVFLKDAGQALASMCSEGHILTTSLGTALVACLKAVFACSQVCHLEFVLPITPNIAGLCDDLFGEKWVWLRLLCYRAPSRTLFAACDVPGVFADTGERIDSIEAFLLDDTVTPE
ncbi:hypothetical protein KIPB_000923 [Kipferlia bialata]|uniref:Uncharacterized protein n=1 Tax=Kipferlia bialata TaxID=797122 RepID=A0A391NTT4_9EUKA|nr:hypothetical protein KIPB_000923 [Kipferlia bialata]|eukprot:g923.t1